MNIVICFIMSGLLLHVPMTHKLGMIYLFIIIVAQVVLELIIWAYRVITKIKVV